MIEGHGDDIYRYDDIRMNFSSNVYGHADLSALEDELKDNIHVIRSYPESASQELEGRIAEVHGIAPGEVLVTAGATDAIYLIAQYFRDMGTCAIQYPTFSEYYDACRSFGYSFDDDAAIGWLCNPNNPTGEVYDDAEVERMAGKYRWLVVDQSYEDYTTMPLLSAQRAIAMGNVLQVRSMTKKYAVPGLRLGYVTGPERVIGQLRSQYRPWTVNALAIVAGKWLLRHQPDIIPDLQAYLDETQRLRKRLNALVGITAHDTHTNFFLCEMKDYTAAELKEYLAREHGMLIRDAANFKGLSQDYFRVAAASPAENDALVKAVGQFITLRGKQ